MELDRPPPVVHASHNWGLHTPVSHRLFGLMLCSTLSSLAILLTNHSPRFRRADHASATKKAPHNPMVVVTDCLAVISLLNGLLAFFGMCGDGGDVGMHVLIGSTAPAQASAHNGSSPSQFAAPVEVMTVQVPHGVYVVAEPVDVPSTSLGFAVAFSLLTAGALAASSLQQWSCYTLGCRIGDGTPPPRWKTWAFMVFEFTFIVLWFGSHVYNQYRLRTQPFHGFFGACREPGPNHINTRTRACLSSAITIPTIKSTNQATTRHAST